MAKNDEGGLSPNATLVIGLVLCAALVVVVLAGSRFWKAPPPPPPPPVAQPAAQSINTTLKYSEGFFKANLAEDAKRFQIPAPEPSALAQPLPYSEELAEPRTLKADKDQLDTPHLHIATHVSKEWSMTGAAQRMRVEHMMLDITNKSGRPIAYRVETAVPDAARCKSKGAMAQNAVALKPNETIQRSECLWTKGSALQVKSVEVMELPDLGYFYVSRLIPTQALLSERTSAGHEPPIKLKPCSFVPWREIRTASESKGGVGWADVIDFYARHNCDEYTFFSAYRRWTKPGTLPARDGVQPPADGQLEPPTNSR